MKSIVKIGRFGGFVGMDFEVAGDMNAAIKKSTELLSNQLKQSVELQKKWIEDALFSDERTGTFYFKPEGSNTPTVVVIKEYRFLSVQQTYNNPNY